MITLIDSTKTTGLIFFPGTMVGMLLAGAEPHDAVRLQLILLCDAARKRRACRADRGDARLPELLHAGPPAARAAGAVGDQRLRIFFSIAVFALKAAAMARSGPES